MSKENREDICLRPASEEDAEALLAIYAPYVERTAVSFEYEVPSLGEFRERVRRIRKRYPYLLAESGGEILRMQGIMDLCACIACPDGEDPYLSRDSILFHQRMGFQTAGRFPSCGYKFHRWYHMVWMMKSIGEHRENQPEVKPFSSIRQTAEEKLEMKNKRVRWQGE